MSDTQALYSVIRGDILSPANSGPVFCDANFKLDLAGEYLRRIVALYVWKGTKCIIRQALNSINALMEIFEKSAEPYKTLVKEDWYVCSFQMISLRDCRLALQSLSGIASRNHLHSQR